METNRPTSALDDHAGSDGAADDFFSFNTVGGEVFDAPDISARVAAGELLPRDMLVRWRLVRERPYVSRWLLARIAPHKIDTAEEAAEIADEVKRRERPLRAALSIARAVFNYGVSAAIFLAILFAAAYCFGEWIGHPVWFAALGVGSAALFTLVAAYKSLTAALLSDLEQTRQAGAVRDLCAFALPGLMYAVASPNVGLFEPPGGDDGTDRLLAWLAFYGYMLLDIVTANGAQAVAGQLAALKPASKAAGVGTLWINLLMATGVIAAIINVVRERLRNVIEFSSTIGDLPRAIVAHAGGSAGFRVTAVARESFFPNPPAVLADDVNPLRAWALRPDGAIEPLTPPLSFLAELGVSRAWLTLRLIELVARAVAAVIVTFALFAAPGYLLARHGFDLGRGASFATGVLSAGLLIPLAAFVMTRSFTLAARRGEQARQSPHLWLAILVAIPLLGPGRLAMAGTDGPRFKPLYTWFGRRLATPGLVNTLRKMNGPAAPPPSST